MNLSDLTDIKSWINPRHKRFWALLALILYTLAGFFLLPWVLQRETPQLTQHFLSRDATIEDVRFNPFTLQLRASGFSLIDEDVDSELVGFDELDVNLQLRSVLKLALVFKEVALTGPRVNVVRYGFPDTNIGRMLDDMDAAQEPVEESAEPDDSSVLRLIIDQLDIIDGAVDLQDQIPNTPFNTQLAPINISVSNVNTLPGKSGSQQVTVTTETGSELAWNGYLQISPLKSSGKITISGSPLPLIYRYFSDQLNFKLQDCCLDIDLTYFVESTPDGNIDAHVFDFGLSSREFEVTTLDGEETVLLLPELRISGGELFWPQQTLRIEEILLDKPAINVWMEADGALNLDQLMATDQSDGNAQQVSDTDASADPEQVSASPAASPENPPEEPAEADASAELLPDWDLSLGSLRVEGLEFKFEDRSLTTPGVAGVSSTDIRVSELSNSPGGESPFAVSATIGDTGNLAANGQLTVLPEVEVNADIAVTDLPIMIAQPWVETVASILVEDGLLYIDGELTSNSDEQLDLVADISLTNLSISDTVEDKPLVGWKELKLAQTHAQLDAGNVEISEIVLSKPFTRLIIAQDGSTNFQALAIEETDTADTNTDDTAASEDLVFSIGKTTVIDGSSDFQDFSLPLPFAVKISELSGGLTALANNSSEPSDVSLEGQVGEYGFLDISGSLAVMDPASQSNILALFRNVNMPYLSPYTAEFAGRKISTGSMDLDLGYSFENQQMTGNNKLVINDFKLGEEVDSPDAMNLPLDLAVALLTDVNGVIDLQLDVSGDMDDPEFSAAGIVLKAFGNLITKIVAAPFKLLGSLIPGGGGEDFDAVQFQGGRADLMPQEEQKIDQLSEALALRPSLRLQVPAGYNSDIDSTALRSMAVDAELEELLGDQSSGDDEMLTERTRKALEKLAGEQLPDVKPRKLRKEFLQEPPDGGRAVVDEVAYSEELRTRLEAAKTVDEPQLIALAENRRAAIITRLSASGTLNPEQLEMSDPVEYEAADNDWVAIELGVSIDKNAPKTADGAEKSEAPEAASESAPEATE